MKTSICKTNYLIITLLFLNLSSNSFAQLREGFNPDEAKSLIAICNSYTFLELYGSDTLIIPKDYHKTFTSEVIGLDNIFQVYESNNVGVINFRGSTANTSSWVENVFTAMIPGEGSIKIDNIDRSYKFASNTAAAVHSGYSLAVVLLGPSLIEQINVLNEKGIYNILITGHSQGGALAILSHAYFENLSEDLISSKNVFKTYAFANPMCGNKEFAEEYEAIHSKSKMSYSIINPADLVPKMPMHYQDKGSVFAASRFKNTGSEQKPVNSLSNIIEYTLKVLEPTLKVYINYSNKLIEMLVARSYVTIEMPEFVKDINYYHTGTICKLEPFSNPKVKIDTQKMTQKEIAKLKRDQEGNYYKKGKSFFQHKPYQYYLAILKEYYSCDYNELDFLYLPEELDANTFVTLNN